MEINKPIIINETRNETKEVEVGGNDYWKMMAAPKRQK